MVRVENGPRRFSIFAALLCGILVQVPPLPGTQHCGALATTYTTTQSPYGGVVSSLWSVVRGDGRVHLHTDAVSGIETLYYTETISHRVLSADPETGLPLTLAGGTLGAQDGIGSAARFNAPQGLTTNANGIVFITDTGNNCIRRLDPLTRSVTTLAGLCTSFTFGRIDGNASVARFKGPVGIVWDGNTYLYVCDQRNYLIRRVDDATGDVVTVAGDTNSILSGANDGFALWATFNYPTGIAMHHRMRTVYITDMYNHRVRVLGLGAAIDGSSVVSTLAGSFNAYRDGVGTQASFSSPNGIALSVDGRVLYIADSGNCAIRRLVVSRAAVTTLSGLAGCAAFDVVDGPARSAMFFQVSSLAYYYRRSVSSSVVSEGLFAMDTTTMRKVTILPIKATRSVSLSAEAASLSVSQSRASTSSTLSLEQATRTSISAPMSASATGSQSVTEHSATDHTDASTTASGVRSLTVSHSNSNSTRDTSSLTHLGGTRTAVLSMSSTMACDALSPNDVALHHTNAVLLDPATQWNPAGVNYRRLVAIEPSSAFGVGIIHPDEPDGDGDGSLLLAYTGAPLVAQALPRVALIALDPVDESALLVNVSLRGHNTSSSSAVGLWRIAQVSHRLDTVPQLLVAHNFTTTATSVGTDPLVVVHTVVVHPLKTRSWMQGVGLFQSTTMTLVLTMRCASVAGHAADIAIQIPAPAPRRELASEVRTATTSLQWAAVVAGVGAGGSVGRVAAIRNVALCASDGDSDGAGGGGGLLSLRIGSGGRCLGDDAARGAVVGNTMLLVGGAVLLAIGCAMYRLLFFGHGTKTFLEAARRLSAPSSLLPLCIILLPSTAGGVVALAATADCALDVVVLLIGGVVCVLPAVGVALTIAKVLPELVCEQAAFAPKALCVGGAQSRWEALWARVVNALGPLFHRRRQWLPRRRAVATAVVAQGGSGKRPRSSIALVHRPSDHGPTTSTTKERTATPQCTITSGGVDGSRHAQTLLLEYRVVWFAALDAMVLAAAGGLGSASNLGGRQDTCVAMAASIVALYVLELVACFVVKPFTTIFAQQHALLSLALSTASIALQLGSIMSDANDLESQDTLMKAAAACDLAVIGVSCMRIIMDLGDMAKSLLKVAQSLVNTRDPAMSSDSVLDVHRGDTDAGLLPPLPLMYDDVIDAGQHIDDNGSSDEESMAPMPAATSIRSDDGSIMNASMIALEKRFWDPQGNARRSSSPLSPSVDNNDPTGMFGMLL